LKGFGDVLAAPPANEDFTTLALLHAAQSASQLEDWKQVLSKVDRSEKDYPDSAYKHEVLFEKAWAIQKQGKPDESLKLYEQVAEATEREVGARARFMMGEVLFGKKDYKEAVRNYFKVAYGYGYPAAPDPIKKWQANSVYEAAICFENLNLKEQALKSYKEVVEKYPQSERAADAKKRATALEG